MKESEQKKEIRISKSLQKKLGPEYISYRPGWNSTKVAYVEGWTIISLANKIFGYNGWSSEIKRMEIDYCDTEYDKIHMGVSCVVRITLNDGCYREDVGFGSSENQKTKSVAYEKAKKEAVTDALKRAFRQFGNALGNCCYDKEFIKDIQSVAKHKKIVLDKEDLIRKDDIMGVDKEETSNFSFDEDLSALSNL
ncbi:DNA repair and recombination protein RAD52 [Astathelohania contejeani]|uniref:DNA repair and recombination protein RAD52 n=1 Tax=Astathelohania contejeani TaxID=164912 RepID=A0ABQ7HWV5_9MICR|nr:DNA repair and recombination protein RAD52 [Thelohania contejeani]